MKRLLLFSSVLLSAFCFSQTTLFQDDFESGSAQWTLNTGFGDNAWAVNNAYLGFTGFIADTPNQPVGITNSPQSSYMHIVNGAVCSALGVCNANFDTGSASNQNAEIGTAIDASGYTNVTVSFWYLCVGQTGVSAGQMEYSLDGGVTWIGTGTEYSNVSTWTQESVSLPAWDNAAAFRFRFNWQNGGGGLDPAFSVDEVEVTGVGVITNDIVTGLVQPVSWCSGSTVTGTVDFVSTGTYNLGNTYTAELSDMAGSFAAPMPIGLLNSSASGALSISVAITGATPVGLGYRIRVVASDPSTIGTDNGTDLEIHPLPTVSLSPFTPVCVNGGNINLIGGVPVGGDYSGTGVSTGFFDPDLAGLGTHSITYYYIDTNGCDGSAVETVLVNDGPTVVFGAVSDLCVAASAYTLSEGSPAGGVYSGTGVTGGVFDPATAGIGTWTITYDYTDGNGCSGQASTVLEVTSCLGLAENKAINYSIYPNPTEGNFTVNSEVEFDAIELRDLNGRLIKTIFSNELIDVSELSGGVYIIEMNYAGQLFTERLMIK